MSNITMLLLAPILLLTTAAGADQARMSVADEKSVQQALDRGTLIYAYDQAAWHGTDDVRAKVADLAAISGGWIVDGTAAAPELVFFDKDKADPHAVYIADFKDNVLVSGKVLGTGDDTRISPIRKRMIDAIGIARVALAASDAKMCVDQPFNTVVLSPQSPTGAVLVYFLTPQTSNDSLPFGGHYLVEVLADGKAGSVRNFTNTCVALSVRGENKAKSEALVITHLLDQTPTEIHVFSSLAAQLPIYVVTHTPQRIWAVEGYRIRLIDETAVK